MNEHLLSPSTRHTVACALFALLLPVSLFAQNEKKAITAAKGESFVMQIVNDDMTTYFYIDEYDPTYVDFIKKTRYKTKAQFIFKAKEVGTTTLRIFLKDDYAIRGVYEYTVTIEEGTGETAPTTPPKKEERVSEEKRYYEAALRLYRAKVYGQAEKEFQAIIQRFPLSPYAAKSEARIGDIHFAGKDYTKAIAAYENVMKSLTADEDEIARAYYYAGLSYMNRKDHDAALPLFIHIEKFYPQSAYTGNALYYAGRVLYTLGKKEDAVQTLERALALKETKGFTHEGNAMYFLAAMYDKGGDETRNLQKAYEWYDAYVRKHRGGTYYKKALARKNHLEEHFIDVR